MNAARKKLLATMWLVLGGTITSGTASAGTHDVSEVAPPPTRIENVPPRQGFIWAPGHWEWNGHSYAWLSGNYIYEQRYAKWIPDHWEQVGSKWRHIAGRWER
jgi:hypothetical protein